MDVHNRPWTDADTRKYVERGHTGVAMRFGRQEAKEICLRFLPALPGLINLEIWGPLKDDSAAFDIPTLRTLKLNTGARTPARLGGLPSLETLVITGRDGLESMAGLRRLRHLALLDFRGGDLRFLSEHSELAYVQVDAKRQELSLAGIEGAQHLTELLVRDCVVGSLAPLAGLADLRSVHIVGTGKPAAQPWDLGVLASARELSEIRLPQSGPLLSLAPLRGLPALTAVCIGLDVVDGDLQPLVELPPDVNVVPFDNRRHYTPSAHEVEAARAGR